MWAGKDSNGKAKEAVEQARKVLRAREKGYGWDQADTKGTAILVIEMMAEGKERDGLRKRNAKSDSEMIRSWGIWTIT